MSTSNVPLSAEVPASSGDGTQLFLNIFHASIAKDDAKDALDKFMSELTILPYLSVVKCRTSSWGRNRPMLLAKVVCANWATEPAIKTDDRYIVRNPDRFYEAHLELALPIGRSTRGRARYV